MVIVIIVLLVLSVMGVTSSDTSNLQQIMARNSQLRLEAFNTSAAEIEAQLQSYQRNARQPDNDLNRAFDAGEPLRSPKSLSVATDHAHFDKTLALRYLGECEDTGSTIGTYRCNLYRLDSQATLPDTSIASDQAQTFSYKTY